MLQIFFYNLSQQQFFDDDDNDDDDDMMKCPISVIRSIASIKVFLRSTKNTKWGVYVRIIVILVL